MRRGVSLVEMLIVIGVIGVLSALSVPIYRTYQARSDLNRAAEQTVQGLARAKLLSQNAEKDSGWGFYVPHGTIYKGAGYATRDQQFDEVYPMPSTVAISGSLLDVAYSKLEGKPDATGLIVLTAVDGQQRTIAVAVNVEQEALAAVPVASSSSEASSAGLSSSSTLGGGGSSASSVSSNGGGGSSVSSTGGGGGSSVSSVSSSSTNGGGGSSVSSGHSSSAGTCTSGNCTICHKPGTSAQKTMTIPSSAWKGHHGHGDTIGACGTTVTLGSPCPSLYTLGDDGSITLTAKTTVKVTAIASQITYGSGGPSIPVYLSFSQKKNKWSNLFSGAAMSPNLNQTMSSVTSGSPIAVQIHGLYKVQNWTYFDSTQTTGEDSDAVITLRLGDAIPTYVAYGKQQSIEQILQGVGAASNGKITVDKCSLIILSELGGIDYPPLSTEDFQDAIIRLDFTQAF